MAVFQMVYVGTRKIYAIKAVRAYCGIGLKEAKDACESDVGFLVSPLKAAAIVSEYLSGNKRTDGSVPERNAEDWRVGEYNFTSPMDLTCSDANIDALLGGTLTLQF